ncbi:hypothetical protein ATJ88_0038 [Isoptericola jiangsuensis]|uniref:Uncharacterized protein n=1 Tax=Isoptericola jiangsuensis TaxID=548579 RepID=A0A2A9ERM4_9MICO|nr:hypothetical protein ATJ88_0038 [Isoptericola jiangsuensis]
MTGLVVSTSPYHGPMERHTRWSGQGPHPHHTTTEASR